MGRTVYKNIVYTNTQREGKKEQKRKENNTYWKEVKNNGNT